MVVTIKIESHAVIEQRAPLAELKLALHQARQAVVGGPGVEKKTVLGHSLAERGDEARGQPRFAKVQMQGVDLMRAIAAVLLPLTPGAVHESFLRAIVDRVDR